MTETERLFVGIAIPPELRGRIEMALQRLPGDFSGRLVPPDNWHITVRFLGDTNAHRKATFGAATAAAVLPPSFPIHLAQWGAFPRPGRGRVLWLGVGDRTGGLQRAFEAVEAAARAAGFPAETRPFAPHLTIARLRTPSDLTASVEALPPVSLAMTVEKLTVFRSVLGAGPPRYVVVRDLPLPD
jgi:RNA 2',3'-cyclic 3'-phosphodiesterase